MSDEKKRFRDLAKMQRFGGGLRLYPYCFEEPMQVEDVKRLCVKAGIPNAQVSMPSFDEIFIDVMAEDLEAAGGAKALDRVFCDMIRPPTIRQIGIDLGVVERGRIEALLKESGVGEEELNAMTTIEKLRVLYGGSDAAGEPAQSPASTEDQAVRAKDDPEGDR